VSANRYGWFVELTRGLIRDFWIPLYSSIYSKNVYAAPIIRPFSAERISHLLIIWILWNPREVME
jgi:hypothetical protein